MKGQASLDNLLMLGLGLLLATSFFYVTNVMLSDSIASAQAKDSVNKIASEVGYVYASGVGTIRYADITIPNGIETIDLDGNRIHMRVLLSSGSTDFYSNSPVKLVGSLPLEPGYERIMVKYLESGNVQVGTIQLSANPKRMDFVLARSTSSNTQLDITNNAAFTITGITATRDGLSDMMTISNPSATLAPGATTNSVVTITVPSGKPSGNYIGYVRINSTNGGRDDTLVSVSVQDSSAASCTISPALANLTIGNPRQFNVTCKDGLNVQVQCPMLAWSSDYGTVVPASSYSSSSLVATNSSATYIRALNGFSCNASVNVTG